MVRPPFYVYIYKYMAVKLYALPRVRSGPTSCSIFVDIYMFSMIMRVLTLVEDNQGTHTSIQSITI